MNNTLILSSPRSGSNFLGQVLTENSNVFNAPLLHSNYLENIFPKKNVHKDIDILFVCSITLNLL